MAQTQIVVLKPDAFCEHTMQQKLQNATAAEAPPQTPLGSLQRSRPISWFLKGRFAARGRGRRGKQGRKKRGGWRGE